MLTTLFAWIYISFLCWTWGILFIKLIRWIPKNEIQLPHFSIISMIGLSIITILAGSLSLIMPLGDWWVHFIFILPCLILFFQKNKPYFFASLKIQIASLHLSSLILLFSSLLLILVMSTWTIVHPDTLGYHAQIIQWIEEYKAVPGLVHLHARFGNQGFWFIDCALFDLSFTGKQGITFLNSTILVWFFIFIIDRIDLNFFKQPKKLFGLLWLFLLLLTLWSYTQVRLTATSASPDFIATLFVLTIIYLLLNKGPKNSEATDWLLAGLLSVVGITIKISIAPISVITVAAGLYLLISKKFKLLFVLITIFAITFSAFITRNIVTSGYPIFPSTTIDIANVDWKYNKAAMIGIKNYITAYAKKPGVVTKEEINAVNQMNIQQWMPAWWKNQSLADKTILVLFTISLLSAFLFIRKLVRSGFITMLVLLALLSGIIFWFINAPDPRFGFGFILGFIAAVTYVVFADKEITIRVNVLKATLVISCLLILSYCGYRFKNFFNKDQLIFPLGIQNNDYTTFDCEGIRINSPVNTDFGIIPIPCSDLTCESFSPRGNEIINGFKAK